MENGSMDMYDSATEAGANFIGIVVGVLLRTATMRVVPVNDTIAKMVLRESGSIAIATAGMTMTTQILKTVAATVKPYIVRK